MGRLRFILARLIALVGGVVAFVIAVAIVFVLLDANPDNAIASFFLDAGRTLAGPFKQLFSLDSRKLEVLVNWGLAAVVWSTVASVVARIVR